MVDEELSELRRRRLQQLERQAMEEQAVEQQMEHHQQLEAQVQMVLKQILEPEARERLNTIKLTRPEFAKAVEQQLVMLAQGGRLRQKLSDLQLRDLLRKLAPSKRDYSITRK